MDSNNDQQEGLDDSSDDSANATAERVYFESGNSKKQFYLMCLGVKDDGVSIFDLEEELWKKSSKRREIKPIRSEYAREVLRRSEILITEKTKRPKATNWPIQRSLEWLEANPIQDEADVLFLKGEVSRIKDIITQRQQEEAQEQLQEQGMSWRGALPYLRLIMCLIEDDIKPIYLRRTDVMTRQQLDGRNLVLQPATAFEMIADRWNDPTFCPVAPASECHYDFITDTDCSHDTVAMLIPATPIKVKDTIAGMRTELLRIIANWEQSGQGESGRHEGDDDNVIDVSSPFFGSLAGRPTFAMDSRLTCLFSSYKAVVSPVILGVGRYAPTAFFISSNY
jgi:hypothetical protein